MICRIIYNHCSTGKYYFPNSMRMTWKYIYTNRKKWFQYIVLYPLTPNVSQLKHRAELILWYQLSTLLCSLLMYKIHKLLDWKLLLWIFGFNIIQKKFIWNILLKFPLNFGMGNPNASSLPLFVEENAWYNPWTFQTNNLRYKL